MSFAQLHAAAATAAADAAYLEDVRTVQQLLQQLRRHASAVRALQRSYEGQDSHRRQSQTALEDQQLLKQQQQLQRELETARSAADGVRTALRQLQRHVNAAASISEKQERQLYYSQLVATAGQLLRQLRDAAEEEGWHLQQQHGLRLLDGAEQSAQDQQVTLQRQQQVAQHGQLPSRCSAPPPCSNATSVAQQPAVGASIPGAEAAAPGESGWTASAGDLVSRGNLRDGAATSVPIDLASTMQTPQWSWLQSGACPGPLQLQHQLTQANKSVPIFIPDSKIDASLLQEKRESLAKIHREIKSIQSLYEQMAFFTEEQGERLDAVDQHLVGARQEAARAAREIATAVRQERRRKWRRCTFAFFMLLLLVLFGFALWWNATS